LRPPRGALRGGGSVRKGGVGASAPTFVNHMNFEKNESFVLVQDLRIALIMAKVVATRIPAATIGSMSAGIILNLFHAPPIDEGGRNTLKRKNPQTNINWKRYLYRITDSILYQSLIGSDSC